MSANTSTCACIIAAVLSQAACGPVQTDSHQQAIDYTFFHVSDDLFYAQDATDKASDSFFEGPATATRTQNRRSASDFSNGTRTRIIRRYGHQTGVRAHLATPLAPRLSLTRSAALSFGEAALLLPDGAGILVEPINIHFVRLMGEGQTGLRQSFSLSNRISAAVSANVGIKAAITTTQINSPILAINHDSTFIDPFVGAGVEISTIPLNLGANTSLSVDLEVRYYRNYGTAFSYGFSVGF